MAQRGRPQKQHDCDLGSGLPRDKWGCKRKCFDIWVIDEGRLSVGASGAHRCCRQRGRGLAGSLNIQRCRLEFLNSSAIREGSCGSGRGTWCQRGLHTTSQPGEKGSPGGNVQKAPWLLVLLPAAGCGEGVMGQSTGWHKAGVNVLGESFDC